MREFEIFTDSTCCLSTETMEKYKINCIPMHFFIDGKEYSARRDFAPFTPHEFYELVKTGIKIKSSQINQSEYEAAFKQALDAGKDVLSVSCTGALSASVRESMKARDALKGKYEGAKIITIDSLSACFALGMVVVEAAKLREQGKGVDEVAAWIEENKSHFSEVGTVEKLTYLKNAGRISASAAFFGNILGVKPVIVADELGNNVAIEKVKGRKNSLEKCAEHVAKYAQPEVLNKICIAHGDCLADAETLAEMIKSKFPENTFEFEFGYIEQGMGTSCGPGTIIVDYYGKEGIRTTSKK
ncbi:MAG: DegV family protein [Clostridia bacterium]|nr:DegV family protein [Clostridia bacterium]